ncbi:MAG TPA: DsbE family thiol:disulfide interchange protein [Gammaproteobacteria bacterium]|jgi:cytochrome c biogenesis protein CcmG/thiol:disulfide interchange protein DsbE|nr:DsbE family thiol:disulfide interchange protein [Gammaproteobacteria bacterium]
MKTKLIVPFAMIIALLFLLGYALFHVHHDKLPSAFIGEAIPAFHLVAAGNQHAFLTEKTLSGKPSLVNFCASWCDACAAEQPMLMKMAKQYHVAIYAIAYKDTPAAFAQWLKTYGNPYVMAGLDTQGDVAIDWGVYGTPETFVVSAQGKIMYRHIGVIREADWDKIRGMLG